MLRKTFAEIHLKNISHNVLVLKKLHGDHPFFCPMIKANGYGHGDVEVARVLENHKITHMGVVLVEEGIRLRNHGIKSDILVFGTFDKEAMEELLENNLTPVISDQGQLETLASSAKKKKVKFHLKFNTGMNRLGFDESEVNKIQKALTNNTHLEIEGLCTHFHSAEDANNPNGETFRQLRHFFKIVDFFDKKNILIHCLNSASLLRGVQSKYLLGARPGISLYGIRPFLEPDVEIDLKPVMYLKSYIGQIHEVKKGQSVSYGGLWTANQDSLIATVPVGYADGYSRHFSNNGFMLFRGKKVPVIGIVCMDYTMIDLSDFKNEKTIEVGEEVCVFGSQKNESFHSWEQAKLTRTHPYELVTRISERAPRVYIR